jgi:hypothetical protein
MDSMGLIQLLFWLQYSVDVRLYVCSVSVCNYIEEQDNHITKLDATAWLTSHIKEQLVDLLDEACHQCQPHPV